MGGRPPRPLPPPSPPMVLPAGGGGNIQVREGGRGRGQALEHGLRVALQQLRVEVAHSCELPHLLVSSRSWLLCLFVVCIVACVLHKHVASQELDCFSQNFPHVSVPIPFFGELTARTTTSRCSSTISSYIGGFALRPTWACVYRTEAARCVQ